MHCFIGLHATVFRENVGARAQMMKEDKLV